MQQQRVALLRLACLAQKTRFLLCRARQSQPMGAHHPGAGYSSSGKTTVSDAFHATLTLTAV